MKAEPHTHKVEVYRYYGASGGHMVVKYGDTRVQVRRWWYPPGCFWKSNPPEALLRRTIEKAVRRHDEGSLEVGKDERLMKSCMDLLQPADGRWGSDVLRAPKGNLVPSHRPDGRESDGSENE